MSLQGCVFDLHITVLHVCVQANIVCLAYNAAIPFQTTIHNTTRVMDSKKLLFTSVSLSLCYTVLLLSWCTINKHICLFQKERCMILHER